MTETLGRRTARRPRRRVQSGGGADPKARPTLKTIAQLTGLGVTTVSRALHDAPDIGQATKDRVRLVAEQIGYRPNRAGVRLRTGRTHVVALILSLETEEMGINSQLISGVSEYLSATAYQLIVMPYEAHSDLLLPVRTVVETGSADGIIFNSTELQDTRARYLEERGFPFATHGRTNLGITHPYFDFDNERYAENAVERLVSLGRHRLALLAPPMNLTYAQHLTTGFARAIERHDLVDVPVRRIHADSPHEQIQDEICRMMGSRRRPDGFVCAGATAALSVSAGAESAGYELSRDFDVVVKESSDLIRKFRPAIDTAHEDFRFAGRWLAETIVGRIEGRTQADAHHLDAPKIWPRD
ncbi:LacI family transcriptional regulator [Consotaella aegiceratis]|uniref:LacI family transcriptional regulator n=1 Tax=Consotaella aegiceratis TaxID=3097961 RepID=UPI002F3FDFC8